MALTDRKLTEALMQNKGNVGKAKTPGLTYTQQQEVMDELVRDCVKSVHNGLIDDLESTSASAGADLIGFYAGTSGLSSVNPGAALRELKAALDAAVLAAGNVPAGGSTDQVLAKNSGADNDLKWATPLNRETYTAEISATWTGSTAPYTQEVAITGMLASDAPHITPVYSDTLETALLQKEAWAAVSEADAGAGKITFTCFEDKPATAIPILVEVMR